MKDAVATMGTTLTDDVGGRDAVHVAVISVTAGQILEPGEHVGVAAPLEIGEYVAATSTELIGIVDPFLKAAVRQGQRFWLYLYPRTITSLHHQWTHPKLGDGKDQVYATPANRIESEQWLRNYLGDYNRPSYDDMLRLVNEGEFYDGDKGYGLRFNGEYLNSSGRDASGDINPMLWHHLEIVTGKSVKQRPTYFACSC